jgi:hypothetical protein
MPGPLNVAYTLWLLVKQQCPEQPTAPVIDRIDELIAEGGRLSASALVARLKDIVESERAADVTPAQPESTADEPSTPDPQHPAPEVARPPSKHLPICAII